MQSPDKTRRVAALMKIEAELAALRTTADAVGEELLAFLIDTAHTDAAHEIRRQGGPMTPPQSDPSK